MCLAYMESILVLVCHNVITTSGDDNIRDLLQTIYIDKSQAIL